MWNKKRRKQIWSLQTEVEHQNAVELLIHTLTMHFVGNQAEELESKKNCNNKFKISDNRRF